METDPYERWVETYKPIHRFKSPDDGPFDGLMFETYGPDLQAVNDADPDFVWTLLDCDGHDVIAAGRLYVNRVGYFITEVSHGNLKENLEGFRINDA